MAGGRNLRAGCGRWTHLYSAIDSIGNTIDFLLSPNRDLTAAKGFPQLTLSAGLVSRRVINVDGHPAYASAISELKAAGELSPKYRCRPSPYLNNIIEQDHRFVKKRSPQVRVSDQPKEH
jgi:transposase-like protein